MSPWNPRARLSDPDKRRTSGPCAPFTLPGTWLGGPCMPRNSLDSHVMNLVFPPTSPDDHCWRQLAGRRTTTLVTDGLRSSHTGGHETGKCACNFATVFRRLVCHGPKYIHEYHIIPIGSHEDPVFFFYFRLFFSLFLHISASIPALSRSTKMLQMVLKTT